MDVDAEVEPTLREMTKRMAVMRDDLLPALRQLDEDAVLSFYSIDEQARLYLSAAFTLALSLYSLDKITHRTPPAGNAAAPRLTGAGSRNSNSKNSSDGAPSTADTQLVLKIERITEYIKKLQELATLENTKKAAAAAAAAGEGEASAVTTAGTAVGKKRQREAIASGSASAPSTASKKSKGETVAAVAEEATAEDKYGDAQMFSVVSRVAGEAGTMVSRLLKQVMAAKPE